MNALGMIDLTASDSESSLSSGHQSHDEDVVYSRWKGQLLDCLNGITSSGDFSASRQYQTFPNPCLRIAGRAAVIPLPLTDHDAEAIRGACKEAPFGRGDETLVDTSVRKTWELDATHFECTNPSWPAFFRTVLDDVATGLGLPNVRAKPHKLLLYEKGSFFKRHKDSEKEVGMIATLVICLPAAHRGGSVQLSFGPEKREIATAPASPFDITALAWFSDVDHEIKPLNFGHRLVLTYKLFQSGSAKRSAHFLVEQSRQLKSILGKWRPQFPTTLMLAYPLEHQYTKSSLSLKNLKGRDHAVCHSLKEISAACDLHLALAHMTRTEDDPDDYYGTGDGEVSVTLDTIYSCEGLQIGSSHDVDEAEILGSIFKDREPDSEDEGEFTGNESAPSSFRYHDTV
ncbi:putative 2og-fe oxygenase superfamily protein [Phaeoacremonium minimum UCRPA7]|uniref:Putative 2og-fe oxygenase superfamily protein n=1 Tax=Phaeoacremonium minimum (strain UCR-PA7) TaxID=1286976 RepID=R8BGC4_PHAM7|nr:putative 2og-fe oxygenase superfamily protein [Phaeoacremonium minimum UCRPA7]EON98361.1 putative 2og-fe oxygenase superfamily protein [Phaeoacremonium minimum UCRPA7]